MTKVIFYYQTFTSLSPLIAFVKERRAQKRSAVVTHIHLAAAHFGVEADGTTPYIHLNDYHPTDKRYDTVWAQLGELHDLGIEIKLMIGGAGGGYASFFSNFEAYYNLLYGLLLAKPILSGVDLDVEEPVSLDNIKKLIARLAADFKPRLGSGPGPGPGSGFTISMAPIQASLQVDGPGMGGFGYKELMRSQEGAAIDYLNGQFYADYSLAAYDQVVANGYHPEQVVMGLLGDESFAALKAIATKYGEQFGGVFLWEYSLATPSATQFLTAIESTLAGGLFSRLECDTVLDMRLEADANSGNGASGSMGGSVYGALASVSDFLSGLFR